MDPEIKIIATEGRDFFNRYLVFMHIKEYLYEKLVHIIIKVNIFCCINVS